LIKFILLSGCVLFSAAASIFLKIGASALSETFNFSTLVGNRMVWVGAIFYAAAFLGYIYALRLIPLSLVQPVITAGVSVITALIAVIFFREQMLPCNWIGLCLICAGIFFLFYGRA
jgi:multidrug transporter EmrE-like cation transporter